MKKIIKTKYQAVDGMEFSTEKECRQYEDVKLKVAKLLNCWQTDTMDEDAINDSFIILYYLLEKELIKITDKVKEYER